MKPNEKKQFVIRKYVMANSALEAIRLDKITPVDDCWVDDEWKKENIKNPAMGFKEKK